MNMIIHDDGHTNVVTSDGLVNDTDIQEEYGNLGFEYGTFDFIITNPPLVVESLQGKVNTLRITILVASCMIG